MKTEIYDSLGFDVPVSVPETVEEFDKLAGKVGACLSEAADNVVYRGVLNDFRSKLADALEKATTFPQLREQKKNSKGEPLFDANKQPILEVTETEGAYLKRLKAHLNVDDENFVNSYRDTAASVASTLVFDPKATERKAKTPPKMYLEAADSILAQGGTFEKASEKLAGVLNHPVPPTREGVAFAIQEREALARKDRVAELVG